MLDKHKQAPSVHWLQTGFMEEVKSFGLDENSTIHEIENSTATSTSNNNTTNTNTKAAGVIKTKGLHIKSPIDNKLGTSYVHCLTGDDQVGVATYMLSYSWEYTIGDIVNALVGYCTDHGLDTKRTYIWMCCFCINPHRIVELVDEKNNRIMNKSVTFDIDDTDGDDSTNDNDDVNVEIDFFQEVKERVKGIGHVLALMSPWNKPIYLNRVWCVFEMYTAYEMNCDVTIIMPPEQSKEMEKDLLGTRASTANTSASVGDSDNGDNGENSDNVENSDLDINATVFSGIDKLYQSLAQIKIQNAQASIEDDRIKIMNMVESSNGPGSASLNRIVNTILRKWVREYIDSTFHSRTENLTTKSNMVHYGQFCNRIATILARNKEHEAAIRLLEKSIKVYESDHNVSSVLPSTSTTTSTTISASASTSTSSSLSSSPPSSPSPSPSSSPSTTKDKKIALASLHNKLGSVQLSIGDNDNALTSFRKSLDGYTSRKGNDDYLTATVHHNIGMALVNKCHLDDALKEYEKAYIILEQMIASISISESESQIQTQTSNTEKEKTKLLECYSSTQNSIGVIHQHQNNHGDALEYFLKAIETTESIIEYDHYHSHRVATLSKNIGISYKMRKEYDKALEYFHRASDVCEKVHGEDNMITAYAYHDIALTYFLKEDWDGAVIGFRQVLDIFVANIGPTHPEIAQIHNNIGICFTSMGKYDEAIQEHNKSLEIRLSKFGETNLKTAECYKNIGTVHVNEMRYEDALVEYQKAYDIRVNMLSDKDPLSLATKQSIDKVTKVIETLEEDIEKRQYWCCLF